MQRATQPEPQINVPTIWIAEFRITHNLIDFFTESLEEFTNGINVYEEVEDSGVWVVHLNFHTEPSHEDIRNRVKSLCEAVNFKLPEVTFSEIENRNWVLELSKNFKPIEAGKFFIYSEFSEASNRLIDIKINPGMAFGTGQHETTNLCLAAISDLKDNGRDFKTILDLGCGSGILAIAAAKIWLGAAITASDNDLIAEKVTIENAVQNNAKLKTFTSEGFASLGADKYELIMANILMNPLLDMAEDLVNHMQNVAVLSGFKTDQVDDIMKKYTSLGCKKIGLFERNGWVSLVLSRV